MTLEQMRQVDAIYRHGSINRAARELFLSQSTLSKSVHTLEKELGQEIFVRSYSGVALTAFGEKVMHYVRDMLRSAEGLRALAFDDSTEKLPSLRVSADRLRFSTLAFLSVVGRHAHEASRVKHTQTSASGVLLDVINQKAEIGLLALSTHCIADIFTLLRNSGVEYSRICLLQPALLVPKGHRLYTYEQEILPLCELKQELIASASEEMSIFNDMYHDAAHMLGAKGVVGLDARGKYRGIYVEDQLLSVSVSAGVYERIGHHVPESLGVRQVLLPPVPFCFELVWIRRKGTGLSAMAGEYLEEITCMCTS